MTKIIIFLALTVLLLAVTIAAARAKRTWAWARFLAFEADAALILLSLDGWFKDPFTLRQVTSWILLAASVYVVLHGVLFLQFRGRPERHFERTTRLVTEGVYGLIRHPMYASLVYLAWGTWLKRPTLMTCALAALAAAAAWFTAKTEESDNIRKFGQEYGEYTKRTKMFVPYVFKRSC